MIWNIGICVDRRARQPRHAVRRRCRRRWFNSVDSFASIVVVPPLVALWAWQARRGREPGDVAKIGIGCGADRRFGAVARAGLPAGRRRRQGRRVIWPMLGFSGMGVAFIYYWPVLLALISRAAPAEGQFDADGRVLPVAVRRQRGDGLGRQLLRPDEPGGLLDWSTPRSALPARFSCYALAAP